MTKIYKLTIAGEEDQKFDNPALTAKAIETHTGSKIRGRENIVPRLAQMKKGETYEPAEGVAVTLIAKSPEDEDDDVFDDDEPELPVEPTPQPTVPPVAPPTTQPDTAPDVVVGGDTVPGGVNNPDR